MNKKRRIPKNPDCPLSKTERGLLIDRLEEIELEFYYPYKHISGGFADAKVYQYDDEIIWVEVKHGVEGQGYSSVNTEEVTIERETLKK